MNNSEASILEIDQSSQLFLINAESLARSVALKKPVERSPSVRSSFHGLRVMSETDIFSYEKLQRVALFNVISFLVLLATMSISIAVYELILHDQFIEYYMEISLNRIAFLTTISIMLCLMGAFAIFTLFYRRQEFNTLALEKIGYGFIIICCSLCLITLSMMLEACKKYFVTFFMLLALKIFAHIRAYSNIKYHDDGHDLVTRVEFFCMHITFSFLHAWFSYCVVFTFLQSLTILHPRDAIASIVLTILSVLIISIEAVLYITYFKDIFFSTMIVFCLVGVFTYNDNPDEVKYTALGLLVTLIFFNAITLMHSFRSVFYMKHSRFVQNLLERRKSDYTPRVDTTAPTDSSSRENENRIMNWNLPKQEKKSVFESFKSVSVDNTDDVFYSFT